MEEEFLRARVLSFKTCTIGIGALTWPILKQMVYTPWMCMQPWSFRRYHCKLLVCSTDDIRRKKSGETLKNVLYFLHLGILSFGKLFPVCRSTTLCCRRLRGTVDYTSPEIKRKRTVLHLHRGCRNCICFPSLLELTSCHLTCRWKTPWNASLLWLPWNA